MQRSLPLMITGVALASSGRGTTHSVQTERCGEVLFIHCFLGALAQQRVRRREVSGVTGPPSMHKARPCSNASTTVRLPLSRSRPMVPRETPIRFPACSWDSVFSIAPVKTPGCLKPCLTIWPFRHTLYTVGSNPDVTQVRRHVSPTSSRSQSARE